MGEYFLGIDTSNYTSSLAIIDKKENIILDRRYLLDVKIGEKGLRQSQALFQHINNFENLTKDIYKYTKGIKAVSASIAPRPIEGSYMPVFKASKNFGQSISNLLGIPFYKATHQEGHIRAGVWSVNNSISTKFINIHLSGGTTEFLIIEKFGCSYESKLLGGTNDISAGQFIDRIGVEMGLPFPSGQALEILAQNGNKGSIQIPSFVRNNQISFSGQETYAYRLLKNGERHSDVALAVLQCIVNTLEKAIINIYNQFEINDILLVGGVISNNYIKNRLRKRLIPKKINLFFCNKKYTSDNAVGIALIAKDNFLNNSVGE